MGRAGFFGSAFACIKRGHLLPTLKIQDIDESVVVSNTPVFHAAAFLVPVSQVLFLYFTEQYLKKCLRSFSEYAII